MFRQQKVWSLALVAVAVVLMAAASAQATVVTGNLIVYYNAANCDGLGGHRSGEGWHTTWTNLAPTGSNHDSALIQSPGAAPPTRGLATGALAIRTR